MTFVLVVFVWCLLAIIAWPLAVLLLLLMPLLWLISLPFVALGVVIQATFALLKAILFLPARLLGHRG